MNYIIDAENFSYSYPEKKKKVLHELNLKVSRGEFLVITGQNDGGKSTLCRALAGVIPHSLGGTLWGSLSVQGINVIEATLSDLVPHMGVVLDDPDSQLFTQSVDDEICFALENLCRSPSEIEETLIWAKKVVGIEDLGDRRPSDLSGGQKQKVILAAALALKPEILVLDEPCSQLDPKNTEDIFTLLKEMNTKRLMTIILVSHNSPMTYRFANRLLIMDKGKIVHEGCPRIILENILYRQEFSLAPSQDLDLSTKPLEKNDKAVLLEIENLSYDYPSGTKALQNVNLTVKRGDFLALIGHNGSGKSTLLKCILSLLKPKAGNVYLTGRSVNEYHLADLAPLMGYVQQNPDRQLFSYTLKDEVAFGPHNLGVRGKALDKKVESVLKVLELDLHKEEYPPALSRANRSRAVLASVLAMEPGLLILDEPTGGQDNRGKLLMLELTKELNEKGYTIILVTHNKTHVSQYAERVVILNQGCITEDSLIKK